MSLVPQGQGPALRFLSSSSSISASTLVMIGPSVVVSSQLGSVALTKGHSLQTLHLVWDLIEPLRASSHLLLPLSCSIMT